jgi:class 3 adenylate cyclase
MMAIRLDRFALFYPLRIVGAYFIILITAIYSLQFDGLTLPRIFLIGVLLVYPHVVRYLGWRYSHDRLKIELRSFSIDSFIIGLVVHLTGFTPLPSFVLITVALVNALAVNGFGQMLLSALAIISGIAISMFFGGVNFAPRNIVALDVTVSVFLFIYFTFFGFSVYNSNALLARSRSELREQKAVLEIEKQRSDALLLDLMPADIAAEWKNSRHVEPVEFEKVALLAVDFCSFARALETHGSSDALAHLMHCFEAFDAITGRYGFEKLKTMGDVYVAIAGLSKRSGGEAAAAINAALEVHQFLDDLNESRRAAGKFALEARIAVHTGSVVGGVVRTDKMSFDVWGDAMKVLLQLVRKAPGGQVVISDAARRAAGEGFTWTAAGDVRGTGDASLVFYNVGKRAA